jgi:deazaflavin-dependent oxidoreductase (nitroreductase family)
MPESGVKAKTPWLVKNVVNPLMLLTGGLPILTVRGRRTGRPIRTPINVQELNGAYYVTSPRGETGWSRNLRASGDCELKIKGSSRRCRATEVPPAERGPIIAAYLEKWGNRTRDQFEKLPDPVDHPTFRLDEVT